MQRLNDHCIGLLAEVAVANHEQHAPDLPMKQCHHDLCERVRTMLIDIATDELLARENKGAES